MILSSVSILNFKNVAEANLTFSDKLNCFTGKNGMGKTNLLDAIYYLSFCKSFGGLQDSQIMRHESDVMMVKGMYQRKNDTEEISIGLQKGKRKIIKRNGKEYKRIREHIGLLPVVMVSPLDWDLIRGGSEVRRRLIDMIISQSDAEYLANLIRYNKCLDNRNTMLRQQINDSIMFESLEEVMISAADMICRTRQNWLKQFSPIFHEYYRTISGGNEDVSLEYVSQLKDMSMRELIQENRTKDCYLGYTSGGIHRDDIELKLDGNPMRKIGSQGQCKTYTIALRLAQYEFLKEVCGMNPILLLDDIFDKLDSSRVEHIISLVSEERFGQIFITDTDRTYLDEIIYKSGRGNYKMFTVEDGVITEHDNANSHEEN